MTETTEPVSTTPDAAPTPSKPTARAKKSKVPAAGGDPNAIAAPDDDPAPSDESPPTSEFDRGVAAALDVIEKHGRRLTDGKELDLTHFRAMCHEIVALLSKAADPAPATTAVE